MMQIPAAAAHDTPASAASPAVHCRLCGQALRDLVVDLGMSPLANSYVDPDRLAEMEPFYPLRVHICRACLLVQVEEMARAADIFRDYAYFSSYSETLVRHAERYTTDVIDRLGLSAASEVVEVASNDGYLLRHFLSRGIPVLGIEPAANVAAEAARLGIPTIVEFFGADLAERLVRAGHRADLIVANNVIAHVPDLNGFVRGFTLLLKPSGVVTVEFPHVARLVEEVQFDTIYHEHLSYLSLTVAVRLFAAHGLTIFDVEEIPTHGGSLRIHAAHAGSGACAVTPRVGALLDEERRGGFDRVERYLSFEGDVRHVKRSLLQFLVQAKQRGQSIAAYGAAAKGNTLLNYCGVRTDFIDYVVDRSPHKQGRYLPGTRIPIRAPEEVARTRPDYLLILPWNLEAEIVAQMAVIRTWGGQFVLPVPTTHVHA